MARARKRRKRRRSASGGTAGGPAPRRTSPAGTSSKPIDDQRPPAPWGSFPLVELVVLIGLGLVVAGFFFVEGPAGTRLLVTGLVLASLAGLELSIREHFGGFRSHSLLLSGVVAVATMLGLYYLAALPPTICIAVGAVVLGAGFWILAVAFRNRSGRLVKLR